MESGQQKPVVITWNPPADHDPNVPVECNVKLMVRGDVSEAYNVMLRALVVTVEQSEELAALFEVPPPGPPPKGANKGGVDAPDNKKPPSPKAQDTPDVSADTKAEAAPSGTEQSGGTVTATNADVGAE